MRTFCAWLQYLVIFLMLPGSVFAAIEEQEIINSVLQTHPDRDLAEAAIQVSQGTRLNALGLFDPKLIAGWVNSPMGNYQFSRYEFKLEQLTSVWGLKFFGGYARSDGAFPVYDSKLLTGSDGEVSVGFEVPLLKGRDTDPARNRIEVSRISARQAQINLSERLTALVLESRIAYWDWVYAAVKLRVANQALHLARERERALQVRSRRGDISQFEMIDNNRIILARQIRSNLAEQDLTEKEQKLSLYLRDTSGTPHLPNRSDSPLVVSSPLDLTQDLQNQVEKIMELSPFLQSTLFDVERAQAQLALAQNSLLPALNLKLERIREFGQTNVAYKNQNELRATATLEIPLLFRQGLGDTMRVEGELEAIRAKNSLARQKLQIQFETLRENYQFLLSNIQLSNEEQKLADQLAAGEQRRFLAGQSTLINVNLREETANDAKLRYCETQIIAHQTYARLDAILKPIKREEK